MTREKRRRRYEVEYTQRMNHWVIVEAESREHALSIVRDREEQVQILDGGSDPVGCERNWKARLEK